MAHAAPLLERYRYTHLVFNDDIQGTATCAVGGVYGAMAVQGALFSRTGKCQAFTKGAQSNKLPLSPSSCYS